jgi:hypothetical protein
MNSRKDSRKGAKRAKTKPPARYRLRRYPTKTHPRALIFSAGIAAVLCGLGVFARDSILAGSTAHWQSHY